VLSRRNFSVLVCAAVCMLAYAGCTGTLPFMQRGGKKTAERAPASEEKGGAAEIFELDETDVDSLLTPVVQLSLFHMNVDLYEQFFWNDRTPFPLSLYSIFHGTPDGYTEGIGTIIAEKTAEGDIEYVLERALLKTNTDGSMWWQVHQTTIHRTVLYEVLVSGEGMPLKIRSTHPDTGERMEAVFDLGAELLSAREEGNEDQFFRHLEQNRKAELAQERSFLFRAPEILGKERVSVEGGTYSCVHVRDVLPEDDLVIDYWIGKNVPGRVVKILYRASDGFSQGEVELVQVSSRYEPKFGTLR
jgi:hypothetical protein